MKPSGLSDLFWTSFLYTFVLPSLLAYPITAVVFASAAAHAVRDAAIFQIFFPKQDIPYAPQAQGAIRLITPIDIKHRRYMNAPPSQQASDH